MLRRISRGSEVLGYATQAFQKSYRPKGRNSSGCGLTHHPVILMFEYVAVVLEGRLAGRLSGVDEQRGCRGSPRIGRGCINTGRRNRSVESGARVGRGRHTPSALLSPRRRGWHRSRLCRTSGNLRHDAPPGKPFARTCGSIANYAGPRDRCSSHQLWRDRRASAGVGWRRRPDPDSSDARLPGRRQPAASRDSNKRACRIRQCLRQSARACPLGNRQTALRGRVCGGQNRRRLLGASLPRRSTVTSSFSCLGFSWWRSGSSCFARRVEPTTRMSG